MIRSSMKDFFLYPFTTVPFGSWFKEGQLRFLLGSEPLLSQTSGTKDVSELTAYQSLAAGVVREDSQVILERPL